VNSVLGVPDPGDAPPAVSVVVCEAPPQLAATTDGAAGTSAAATNATAKASPLNAVTTRVTRE
jgi:hypothetical protein